MKAPIVVRVRYRWNGDTLFLMQHATDANGKQDLRTDKYYNQEGQECHYWDDDNWSCIAKGADGKLLFSETMKNGTLTWYLW